MTASTKSLERRLARAYALLSHVSEDEHGFRAVSLERCGSRDIRLLEVTLDSAVSAAKSLLFLELYDDIRQVTLDSCRCGGIEDAAIAAERMISLAKEPDDD
jgi:hypothetical protein